ncbi:MAG: class I SAM-dependent methyltransferase, partial [Candidatus Hodarchaeales archaeon]
KILEVGSGTGAVIEEIMSLTSNPELYALDINWIALQSNLCTNKILGKGEHLPFPDNFFDITLCHYLLLWIENPIDVLKEMYRVTRVGGWIACLAEPDYGGRIDYPYTEEWKSLLQRSL